MPTSITTDSDDSKFDWLEFSIPCTGHYRFTYKTVLAPNLQENVKHTLSQNFRLSSTYSRIELQKYHAAIILSYV
jgi:hypothetical protein